MNTKQENLITLGFAIVLGVYCISFLWNFWSHGYNTLGIGAAFFGLLVLGFFTFSQRKNITPKSLSWMIPMILIMLSLGIYTNPFIKVINIILIPFLYLIFTTHETKESVRETLWSKLFLPEFLASTLRVIGSFLKSIPAIGKLTQKELVKSSSESLSQNEVRTSSSQKAYATYKQITIGIGIFVILAITIVIPLLSSADPRFATLFEKIIDYFISFVSLEGLVKALFVIGVTCIFFGYRLYWQKNYKPFVAITQQTDTRSYSPMIGTILIGLLGLYGLFLFLQAQNLFASALPVDFKKTETLVKSGFWQLLVLTALNTVLYTTIFGKTIRWVQYILGAFTIASLLLLFSAVQRVYLYVTVYGLSYEKFFAFYTVLFCVGMFVWFIYLMITKKKHMPIFKALCFSALWLYSLVSVFPVESFVLSTNLAMTKNEESRIDLNELQMLSFDAIKTFDTNKQDIITQSKKDKQKAIELLREQRPGIYLEKQNENVTLQWQKWQEELIEQKNQLRCYDCSEVKEKKWHEKTLTELLFKTPNINISNTDKKTLWRDPYNGYQVTYDAGTIYTPYSDSELSSNQTFENTWNSMHEFEYKPALSFERFYFEPSSDENRPSDYKIESPKKELSTKAKYETFLKDTPAFLIGKSEVRPSLYTTSERNALVIALYIETSEGYFVISPTNLSKASSPITEQTKLPESFDEFAQMMKLSDEMKEMLLTFTPINQDFSM